MRAIDLLLLPVGALLLGCEGPSEPVASPDPSPPSSEVEPLAGVIEDADARVQTSIVVTLLPDADAPHDSVSDASSGIEHEQVSTRDGTLLRLANAENLHAERTALAAEIGTVTVVPSTDLEKLRLQWFRRGSGVIFQNPTEYQFQLWVHFESSSDVECNETVLRTTIAPRESNAPSPSRADCNYDAARVKLFDQHGLLVAEATVTPKRGG